jgi:hypothetical protein
MEISPVNFCILLASLIGMSVGYIIQEICNCQTENKNLFMGFRFDPSTKIDWQTDRLL